MDNMFMMLIMVSSLFVPFVYNTMQSLLWLIVTFGLTSFLLLSLGAEFVSLLMLLVYMGAVAVLFLFVMMMLNISVVELSGIYLKYLPMGSFLVFFFLLESFLSVYYGLSLNFDSNYFVLDIWLYYMLMKGNMYMIASLLYSIYSYYFMILSLILLVAMMGVMVLTLDEKTNKNYDVYDDYYFNKEKVMIINK